MSKARTMISQNFSDPESLDDLGVLSFELEKQLSTAESQLNGAVQSKLDSLKRAVDLMDESAVKLSTLSLNINRIDQKIAQTNTMISNFDYLKRVHNARDNLSKVIGQVEFFARVPDKIDELHTLLNSNPAHLKEVYLESLKLESLRIALMKEIKVSRNRKMSVGSATHFRSDGDYSESTFSKIREAVVHHLKIVPELVEEVWGHIYSNVDKMWDLASICPANLVATFEIIEMQQEYNDRRNRMQFSVSTEAEPTNSGTTSPFLQKGDEFENISLAMQARIRASLDQKVQGEFEAIDNFADENLSPLTSMIMAANQVLQKMSLFRIDVVPCMPPSYDPMFVFLEAFETQLTPLVDKLMSDLSQLKVAEILDFINWIEYHRACMDEYESGERECIPLFAKYKMDLVMEYKDRIKQQVTIWFDNIKNQPLEITKATDFTLVTSNPEDMFNIIHAQLEVAREKLPVEYAKEVAIACLQVLQATQRDAHDKLASGWKEMEPEAMCALINDYQRMQEKCEEFGDYLLHFIEAGSEKETLTAILAAVGTEYRGLADKAVIYLSRCVLEDLDEPIFGKLFTLEWEQGDNLSTVLVVTLADYFQDLSDWLGVEFFLELAVCTLDLILGRYIMTLRKRSNGVYTFKSEVQAGNQVINDQAVIEGFFEAQLKNVVTSEKTKELYEDLLVQKMEIMLFFARTLTAKNFTITSVEAATRGLFARFGGDGLKVVQAAVLANPNIPKEKKPETLEVVRGLFESGGDHGIVYQTKLSPEFDGFDVAISSNLAKTDSSKPVNTFWGRKKK